mgnify:CR=1 FL=1
MAREIVAIHRWVSELLLQLHNKLWDKVLNGRGEVDTERTTGALAARGYPHV